MRLLKRTHCSFDHDVMLSSTSHVIIVVSRMSFMYLSTSTWAAAETVLDHRLNSAQRIFLELLSESSICAALYHELNAKELDENSVDLWNFEIRSLSWKDDEIDNDEWECCLRWCIFFFDKMFLKNQMTLVNYVEIILAENIHDDIDIDFVFFCSRSADHCFWDDKSSFKLFNMSRNLRSCLLNLNSDSFNDMSRLSLAFSILLLTSCW